MNLDLIRNLFLRIYKPKKSKEYDALQMSAEDFYKIARDKKKAADNRSIKSYLFPSNDIYLYERRDKLINVRPLHPSGGHDTSAIIQILTGAEGKYILKITYYKPTILNNFAILLTIFASIVGLLADSGWTICVAALSCLSLSLANYIMFLNEWERVESEILKTYNLIKP